MVFYHLWDFYGSVGFLRDTMDFLNVTFLHNEPFSIIYSKNKNGISEKVIDTLSMNKTS